MGRYEAQHLFLKGSSLILHATVTSAERERRRKHEERAEVSRIGRQRKETEGTKQGHPKHHHSPCAAPARSRPGQEPRVSSSGASKRELSSLPACWANTAPESDPSPLE